MFTGKKLQLCYGLVAVETHFGMWMGNGDQKTDTTTIDSKERPRTSLKDNNYTIVERLVRAKNRL